MFFHHADERAAEDQHDIVVFQRLIPRVLQDGRKLRVRLYKIRKFIYDKYLPLVRVIVCDHLEQVEPVCKCHFTEHGIFCCPGKNSGKSLHALRFALRCCQKVECTLVLDEFFDQRCFSDAPSAVDYYKTASTVQFGVQRRQFRCPADEIHTAHLF